MKVAAILGWVVALVLAFGYLFGFYGGFDGNVIEPGCDWGNANCEPSDYRSMCADYSGSVHDARWQVYCQPLPSGHTDDEGRGAASP